MSTQYTRSWTWYLLPILFNVIGGIFAYYVIRHKDPIQARECLYIGITLTVMTVGAVILLSLGALLAGPGSFGSFGSEMSEAEIISECLQNSAGIDGSIDSVDPNLLAMCLQLSGKDIFS